MSAFLVMAAPLELVLQNTGRMLTISPGQTITAGRTSHCELQLEDPAVSRRHCSIAYADDGLHVRDLDSVNGTFINDRAVSDGVAQAGDIIRLGATAIEVRDPLPRDDRSRARTAAVMHDEGTIQSVIQRRIEPSNLEWLTTSEAPGAAENALLQRAQRHLSMLHRVSEVLSKARDLDELSDTTLRAILEVLPADRTAMVLRRDDPQSGQPEVAAARTRMATSNPFTVSRTLVSDVIEKGVSVFAHDASSDVRFSTGDSIIGQRVRAVMCVPLRTTDQILGAIYVDSLSGAGRFNEADLELLAAIGNQAGVALHRVRLMGELERLLLDMVKAITATIDARDGYTHRHSERVASLAGQLARELGLNDDVRQRAQLSALLHDVGKIAVPDAILNKPAVLTSEEYTEMQKHPLHGARILGNIESATVKAVLPGVQYHHEKWDGTGYPEGLAGEAIPLLGRLLGVADFFDALTSSRAYRPAMTPEEAIALVAKGAGTHFDPAIAAAAVRLFERGELLADETTSMIARLEE